MKAEAIAKIITRSYADYLAFNWRLTEAYSLLLGYDKGFTDGALSVMNILYPGIAPKLSLVLCDTGLQEQEELKVEFKSCEGSIETCKGYEAYTSLLQDRIINIINSFEKEK